MRSYSTAFAALALSVPALAAPPRADPCVKIAGKAYMAPADANACLQSFPFNETLRRNVMDNVERVFDFFSFKDYYLPAPYPFQESTVNIRAELARIRYTHYKSDYDFNRDLYDFTNQLNDGHTRWFPNCYTNFQNLLLAPITSLEEHGVQNVYVVPDAVEFVTQLGPDFFSYADKLNFNWKRLAGAKVLEIEGVPAYTYVDYIASTQSGNYLDHGARVNSVYSSYRIAGNDFSQRFGDLAGPGFPDKDHLTFKLIPVGSSRPEIVKIPYIASYLAGPFTDGPSFWAANCAVVDGVNGVDHKSAKGSAAALRKLARAEINDLSVKKSVGLPGPYHPTAPPAGTADSAVLKSFTLPDKKTGVIFVGSFAPAEEDIDKFLHDVDNAVTDFKKNGVQNLLIDLTNNGGGYVCLGLFLVQYLSGSKSGYAGFESTALATPLAKKIVASDLALNVTGDIAFFGANNWAFLNDTQMPDGYNWMSPSTPFRVNGQSEQLSQRVHDVCTFNTTVKIPENPPFDLKKVALVGNAGCASTCALFTTAMYERHGTKIAIFGGKPGQTFQYKGMAGNQVLEWADLDSEIKTANLKSDPAAPPDLLVNGNMRHNWRSGWSWKNKNVPIAYENEPPQYTFAYTKDTYNNPQNLWTFAAKKLFH